MKKNILYIAPYRQKDGWGQAAFNYLKSIIIASNKLGYGLKIAPVYFTGQVWEALKSNSKIQHNPELEKYENAQIDSFDIIIQKGLPESLCYTPGYNNIALTVLETQSMKHTSNKFVLNRFDSILVPSAVEKTTLEQAGVKTNTYSIQEPIDCAEIDSYMSSKDPISTKYNHYVKFYFIGEFVERKNVIDLITAFSLAFKKTEKVVLFLKTSASVSTEYIQSILRDKFSSLKGAELNPNIVIINKRLPREELLNLHLLGDIFVCPSKGEAFCIPLAEAMRFGNIPMVVENTGPSSYVNNENGYIIPARPDVCLSDNGSGNLDTYNFNETYMVPTLLDLISSLRQAREEFVGNSDLLKKKKVLAFETTQDFTFEAIGDKICSLGIM